MKRKRENVKRTILKKIEITEKQNKDRVSFGKQKQIEDGLRREKQKIKINKTKAPKVNVGLMSDREKLKMFGTLNIKESPVYSIKDYGNYQKKDDVDCDVVLYVSSYDRYNKILDILTKLYTQSTKYSYEIILMNDGSTDLRYDSLPNLFPEIIFLKNETNNGRSLYWKTINTIWERAREINTNAFIQIDDDFVLCNNFIDRLMDLFFELKRERNSYMGIRYHIPSFNVSEEITEEYFNPEYYFQAFDGGSLFDVQFLEMFDYTLPEIDPKIFKQKFQHSQVWSTLNNYVKKFGVEVYRTRESFVFHNADEESKMHPLLRKTKKIYTKRFNG